MRFHIGPDRATMMLEESTGTSAYLDWTTMIMETQVGGAGQELWEGPLDITVDGDHVTVHREGFEDFTIIPTTIDFPPRDMQRRRAAED